MEKVTQLKFENEMVRKRNFVRDMHGFHRGFVFVEFKNEVIKVGHEFGGVIGRLTQTEYEDLDMTIEYFDRI